GKIRPPDPTKITTDVPNTGAGRLLLTSKDGQLFRLRVNARSEQDMVSPAAPGNMVITDAQSSTATLTFVAPGDDDMNGTVAGYEVHYKVGDAGLTDADFDSANELQFAGDIVGSGQSQAITVKNLLPETDYTVAVRAFDNCHNISRITTATFTTAPRPVGSVDACFVATAAYGSLMANDVEMLRRFRDLLLRRSVLGELAVEAYYTFGPAVAGVVGESDLLRSTAREVLAPIVARTRSLHW
ncbi:MAG TPA: fibronectin type III domain-containing protein, partial [Kofleriaceae bacterium]|nr:fibronectin type III domain-containing protein [Kofleriaceae bacterium]